jgi:CRP-like cAMP-binding protein
MEEFRRYIARFVDIPDSDWSALQTQFQTRHFHKREHFFREGDVAAKLAFIVRGAFRQYFVVDGEEKTTYFSFEESFVTDYGSFLTGQPSAMNLEALEPTEVVVFDKTTMDRLYRLYPKFETFGRLMAEEAYLCAMDRLQSFLLASPEERYRRFLAQSDSAKILARVPQHYVASYLGITPVSLSRIRARVRTVGS